MTRRYIGSDPLSVWDRRFLALAEHIGGWSKDPSTQVGAVIVRPDRTIASVGYNGFPRGVVDDPGRLADRALKYPRTVHAELNAILSANEPVKGFTLYVTPLSPCSNCAGAIIQAGIARVVAKCGQVPPRWLEDFNTAGSMFDEAGVQVVIVP